MMQVKSLRVKNLQSKKQGEASMQGAAAAQVVGKKAKWLVHLSILHHKRKSQRMMTHP
jgi:hypothetical protein